MVHLPINGTAHAVGHECRCRQTHHHEENVEQAGVRTCGCGPIQSAARHCRRGMAWCDALYTWCRNLRAETHNWPETAIKQARHG